MRRRPSASNAEQFVMCPMGNVLPQRNVYSDSSERGTAGHDAIRCVIEGERGAGAKLANAFPGLGYQLLEHIGHLRNQVCEPAYVVDVEAMTATPLGLNIGRDYAGRLGRQLKTYELGVSLDLLATDGDAQVIRDWKFTPHGSRWQLSVQAMAIAFIARQLTGATSDIDAGFVHILQNDDQSDCQVYTINEKFSYDELKTRRDSLMRAFDEAYRLSGLQEEQLLRQATIEGDWCKWCGAFPHCPSKWKLAKSMLGDDLVGNVYGLSMEQCGEAWKKLAEVEKNIVRPLKDALKTRLETEGPFPLRNGKRLSLIDMPGKMSFNKDAVMKLLQKLGASDEDVSSLYVKGNGYTMVREIK